MAELVMETATATKRLTWKDFPLEDHARAFVGVPQGCRFKMTLIVNNIYRVNVIRPDKSFSKTKGGYLKCLMLKVITTPEGYIFQEVEP